MKFELVNNQGCVFDREEFSSQKEALKWARGRGEDYKLVKIDEVTGEPILVRKWKYSKPEVSE